MNILLFGHGGSLNRGCEAIVRSTGAILKEAGGPGIHVRVSSRSRDDDMAAHVDSVDVFMDSGRRWAPGSLGRRFYDGLTWRLKTNAQHFILDNLRTLFWAPRSHVLLAIGGDNYCYDTIAFWYPLQRILRFLSRRMVLWGCSVEEERITPAMLADLRRFDLITARESITQAALLAHGLHHVHLYPDPAFAMEKQHLPLPPGWQEGQMVGLNISPLIESFEQQPGKTFEAMSGLVRHILDSTSMGVVLVPHVTWPESDDRIPLGRIFDEFRDTKRVLMLPENLNAPQTKGYISRCRFFIGARTHATIAAYSTQVPTLALGYSVKARGIARDIFGSENGLVLPVQEANDPSVLIRMFDDLLCRETEIRSILATVMPGYIQSAKDAGREVLALLNK